MKLLRRNGNLAFYLNKECIFNFIYFPPGRYLYIKNRGYPKLNLQGKVIVEFTKGYWFSDSHITNRQWSGVMDGKRTMVDKTSEQLPKLYVNDELFYEFLDKFNWLIASQLKESKIIFDLPSYVQWEYACHYKTSTKYYFGNNMNNMLEHAWCKDNSGNKLQYIKTKKPTNYGLYDMYGNVNDLCYALNVNLNALNEEVITDPKLKGLTTRAFIRGGAYDNTMEECLIKSYHTDIIPCNEFYPDEQFFHPVGMRLVCLNISFTEHRNNNFAY